MKLKDVLNEAFPGGKEYSFVDYIYTIDKYLSPQTQDMVSKFFNSVSMDLKKASQDPNADKNEIQNLLQLLKSIGY